MTIEIYCDGACSHELGIGGWAAITILNNTLEQISGGEYNTTNNKMELTAAINGLIFIYSKISQNVNIIQTFNTEPKKHLIVKIYTDSTYVQKGITSWIYDWKKTQWKNGKIKNVDLWKKLDDINNTVKSIQNLQLEWHWVKAHSIHYYNNMVDSIAKNEVKKLRHCNK